ncbi:MAG: PHP domain-containing protein [Candidatus Cloacimonetes bacterium]|nr:PHP domain-containing protein [Candidatus Cloacimonadota bacterium]
MIRKEINEIRRINLHLHTTVSDGSLSPAQLVKRAQQINLDLISITDHDTVDAYHGLPENILPLKILPGLEVSSQHEERDVHILAYGVDIKNRELLVMTEMYLLGRRDRAIVILEKLKKLGIDIDLKEVLEVSGSRELIVRPHIAQILVKKGYCKSKNEAFDKYIGNEQPAYAPKPEVSVADAIKVIHGAGGFAIAAHPGKLENINVLYKLIEYGIDGIEVWHPDHYRAQIDDFIQIAQKHKLFMTGGSDFHGEKDNHNIFDVVPVNQIVLDSVNMLYKEYLCRKK